MDHDQVKHCRKLARKLKKIVDKETDEKKQLELRICLGMITQLLDGGV